MDKLLKIINFITDFFLLFFLLLLIISIIKRKIIALIVAVSMFIFRLLILNIIWKVNGSFNAINIAIISIIIIDIIFLFLLIFTKRIWIECFPKNSAMKKLKLILIFILIVADLNNGCVTKMNENDLKKWRLKSVEFMKEIELKEQSSTEKIIFKCKKSSANFEFRLYYPLVDFENPTTVKNEADEKILKSLVGFSFELYDLKTKEKMYCYKIISPSFRDNKVFIYGRPPLGFWLASKLKVKKNREYMIVLTIPNKKETDNKFLKPVLVGGIALNVFP